MKNRHPKLKMARKMLTKLEVRKSENPFFSEAWSKRTSAIRKRVADRIADARIRRIKRAKDYKPIISR